MSAANVNKYFNNKSFEIKQGRHAHINHVNMINITYNICTVHNKMKHILIYLMHSKLTFIENLLTVRETYNLTMFTALIFFEIDTTYHRFQQHFKMLYESAVYFDFLKQCTP